MKTPNLLNKKGYPYRKARLKEGKWRLHVEYWLWDFEKNGLIRKRKTVFDGESDAEKKVHAQRFIYQMNRLLKEGLMNGDPYAKDNRDPLPAREAFEIAIKGRQNQTDSKRTIAHYSSFRSVFFKFLDSSQISQIPIDEFNRKQVVQFMDWLKEEREVRNKTRNNYKIMLRACFNELIKRELLGKNPAAGFPDFKVGGQKNIPFTEKERQKLERHLLTKHPDLFNFTRFLYYGFMRPIEILRMKVKHIDLDNRIILVRSTNAKNRKQMPVVITKQLTETIKAMNIEKLPGEWRLFSKKLQPGPTEWIRNRVSEWHRKALEETDLYNGELTLYSWKHSGNCNAYRAGVDIKSIQEQNRHQSLDMTDVYLRSMGLRISSELKNLEW